MKIQYLGHASFLITTNAGTRIVTDPFDPALYPDTLTYKAFNEPADIVTISHDHKDHSAAHVVKNSPLIIRGGGKFVACEVEFLGVETYHDDSRGSKRGKNTAFVISVDGLKIVHLGDLGHILTADQAAEIGAVDITLIPVGGFYTIDACQAAKVAAQLDGIEWTRAHQLAGVFPTVVEFANTNEQELKRIPGIGDKLSASIIRQLQGSGI